MVYLQVLFLIAAESYRGVMERVAWIDATSLKCNFYPENSDSTTWVLVAPWLPTTWYWCYTFEQLPVGNAQPLNTSVDGESIGHVTVVEPESGCAYLSIKHITRYPQLDIHKMYLTVPTILSANTHQYSPVVRVATAEELPCIVLRNKWRNGHTGMCIFIIQKVSMTAQKANIGTTMCMEWQVKFNIESKYERCLRRSEIKV